MPVRHLLVWLAAGAACWSLIAVAALVAPQALLALAGLLVLPWLRRPATQVAAGVGSTGVEPMILPTPAVEVATGVPVPGGDRVLVA